MIDGDVLLPSTKIKSRISYWIVKRVGAAAYTISSLENQNSMSSFHQLSATCQAGYTSTYDDLAYQGVRDGC